ncbi:unnamed protein product, partial [Staurois parvus]
MVRVTSRVQQLTGSAVQRIRQKDGQVSQGSSRRQSAGSGTNAEVGNRSFTGSDNRNRTIKTKQQLTYLLSRLNSAPCAVIGARRVSAIMSAHARPSQLPRSRCSPARVY